MKAKAGRAVSAWLVLAVAATAAVPGALASGAGGIESELRDKVDFAAGLEEALGHFWALEQNLDDNNAELALVHATHPIAELYDSMKPTLAASDPALDSLMLGTLDGLKTRATTDVSRDQAQRAIDDAKGVIEAARTAVVGDDLASDPIFRMKLMKGLLETSVAEYGEAVEDGQITEMAEFQDGSAFVWRAGVIFGEIRGDIDSDAADDIDGMFDAVGDAYDDRADPSDVSALTGALMDALDEQIYASYTERLDFAAGLEETLGHFWALERNLDDLNADLALVHATHPIAELYDSMKPTMVATDPDLDARVFETLDGLGSSAASQSVSVWQAQRALSDARGVVEEARTAVVGDDLASDPKFRLKLMKGLLETSVAEYGEAVEDGQITEMAEFQDGSAFVWRAGVIFGEIRGDIDSDAADDIDGMLGAVGDAYDSLAPPARVADLTGGIIDRIDELTGADGADEGLGGYFAAIDTLLTDARSEYGAGNSDLALSYATKAYLDNYEFLEGPLVEAGERELMVEIEVLMREELREMIKAGDPASSVGGQIDMILDRMDAAAGILLAAGGGGDAAATATAMQSGDGYAPISERLDLAAGLEEALGHFWALELNLDEGNAELAVVHATHPVAELYDAMKPTLASTDPALDRLMAGTLEGLAERASTDVSRDQAQRAIDDARGVIETARTAVVGDALASDPVFKMKLMKGLLETSIAEYGEAVEDGRITEMAEFQDGSAFVWRAGVIFGEIRGDIDSDAADDIDGMFDAVGDAYDDRAPTPQVDALTSGIIEKLDMLAADSYSERLDLAAGLEEALGHFWALELNLDEGNAELAVVHATHPVAELYDAMKPTLASTDPALDRLMAGTLEGLAERASTDVSRDQAQRAIDDARGVIETARTAVVGDALASDPVFKMKLMKGLLETSIAEYGEAVEDGRITEMAEFQDGSAFVWRAGVIFGEIRGDIDSDAADDIDGMLGAVGDAYDRLAPAGDVAAQTGGIIDRIDELTGADASMSADDGLGRYAATIDQLLTDARSEYGAGNSDLALSYVTKAYLDNYEFLEGPLVEAGERELMVEIEVLMREELREMIRGGEPVSAVNRQIDTVLDRMQAANDVLFPGGIDAAAAASGGGAAAYDSFGERLDLAAGLEEALGHFWALELNLDEGNAELAVVHATHPVAELYDAMKPTLASTDPALDRLMAGTLEGLAERASTDVSRDQAQRAIDDARGVIETARTAVVGDALASDPVFKMKLMKGLLETSIAEYGEAVEDGRITEMAEFQDGSAFVWRAGVIFGEIRGDIDSDAADDIDGMFDAVGDAYDDRAPTPQVDALTSGIIEKLDMLAADSYSERLDLAAGLEEALGHFWALELNLDEGNAELAVVHATHPVAELYDAMKPTLASTDPALDRLMAGTLEGLAERASTDVSRDQAQRAIDDARGVIETARTAVVGDALASDPVFKMKLMKGLLETSIAEYGEAVEDGRITEMAEFQDGSAFVWRAGVIFGEIEGSIENRHAAEEIDGFFEDVSDAYDRLDSPSHVATLTNGIIRELDEIMGTGEGAGAAMDEGARLDAYVATIRQLLEDARAEYRAGNNDLALSYVTKAYLDNYEFLEGPLVEAGERELMIEVEELMREELRTMIRSGEPVAEVEAQIDLILDRMDTVAVIVPEFGPVAIVVLAAAVVAIVAVTARSRLGMGLSAPGA